MTSLPVARLMQPCASATITPDTLLREAAEFVLITGQSTLPVVDDSGQLAGIVTESALVRCLMTQSSPSLTVSMIVSQHVQSVRADADLTCVLPLFRSAAHVTIPVVDSSDTPVGLLHRRDVIRYLLDDPESKTGQVKPETGTPQTSIRNGPHFVRRSKQTGKHAPRS